jgi:hypothetical protein
MNATPVAQAGAQAGILTTTEQWLDRTQKALELMRVDATVTELLNSKWRNERLIAWYRGRRTVLAQELGL